MSTYGFSDIYNKKVVSETAVAVQNVSGDVTASGISWYPMNMGSIGIQVNGEGFYTQDQGRLKVLKGGIYRVTGITEISSCTSETTTIDLAVASSSGGGIKTRGSVPASGGTFQGVITAGPEIVELSANERLGLQVRARGGSAVAKGTASKLILEYIAGPTLQ